jgi:hypothetical protein
MRRGVAQATPRFSGGQIMETLTWVAIAFCTVLSVGGLILAADELAALLVNHLTKGKH